MEFSPVSVSAFLVEGYHGPRECPVLDVCQEESIGPFWVDLDKLLSVGEFWYATTLDRPMREVDVTRRPKLFADGRVGVEVRQQGATAMMILTRVEDFDPNKGSNHIVFPLKKGKR